MCKECSCCEEEVELTKEELVESAIENISEGGCLGCTLSQIFDIGFEAGYLQGKQDLAKESIEFYADFLVEDNIEE
ncbi:hypothetical protein [Clostridium estertheticum]|uniref:hypothetical protein n=1 Tax=Clostridium estertheticum TaxID=238834 RepID=UPI001C0D5D05|nr:hypothetical protein [Clostridium estertheticum]MBU3186641.1 hypothetical protein [Clostridium estertheticum]